MTLEDAIKILQQIADENVTGYKVTHVNMQNAINRIKQEFDVKDKA